MSEVTVTISDEQVDEILAHELVSDFTHLQERIEERRKGEGFSFESHDPEEDVEALEELIHAFKKVMEYYGADRQ